MLHLESIAISALVLLHASCMTAAYDVKAPYKPTGSFLVTVCNGGLNQQRGAIVNAVVLARFLNLTLVVPFLKAHPVWGDSRYVENVKPSVQNSSIVLLSPFARRLGNVLPEPWQLFRCKVNYEGLRFVNSILVMGRKVIRRMKKMSSNFVSLHWRFETDAVAYSMCEFGGGEKEKLALEEYRVEHWDRATRKLREALSPASQRSLRSMFPNALTKRDILTREELGSLERRASALAAIDYIVSTESGIFIPTATGNFPNFVIGHRLYYGRRSVQPDLKKLASLYSCHHLSERDLLELVRAVHEDRFVYHGRSATSNFFANPEECLCPP
ncbi:unnamed protein product [Closterium sp. Yama58-4]|nr:unnamed protein product [Closterium sp. Yama58-4]